MLLLLLQAAAVPRLSAFADFAVGYTLKLTYATREIAISHSATEKHSNLA